MLKTFLKIKWQYLAILFLGIFLGVVLTYYWRSNQASAKVVTLQSRGITYTVTSESKSVQDLLNEQGLDTETSAVVPSPDSALTNGMTIVYRSPVQVTLEDAGGKKEIWTSAATVQDVLVQASTILSASDEVFPGIQETVYEGMRIEVVRVQRKEITENEIIEFEVLTQGDPNVLFGKEEVVQQGGLGQKSITYEITYRDGVEVSRKKLSEEIKTEPVPKIIKAGTKIEVESYEQGRASWYAYKGCMCAAHPYFPKGSLIRVTNLANGKSVIVTVNDWGPDQSVHPERVLDLDSIAFKQLAPLSLGTIEVKSEKLVTP